MRITLLFLFWAGILTSISAQKSMHEVFVAGGGGVYSFVLETPGVNARAYFFATEQICFGPETTFFLPTTKTIGDETIEKDLWELSFNAHFLFDVNHRLAIFPLQALTLVRNGKQLPNLATPRKKKR